MRAHLGAREGGGQLRGPASSSWGALGQAVPTYDFLFPLGSWTFPDHNSPIYLQLGHILPAIQFLLLKEKGMEYGKCRTLPVTNDLPRLLICRAIPSQS